MDTMSILSSFGIKHESEWKVRATLLLRSCHPTYAIAFCRLVALISQRSNRLKARPFRSPEDSANDLALNQSTQKGNVLRGIQQVHESATCTEEFHRGFTRSPWRDCRRETQPPAFLPG